MDFRGHHQERASRRGLRGFDRSPTGRQFPAGRRTAKISKTQTARPAFSASGQTDQWLTFRVVMPAKPAGKIGYRVPGGSRETLAPQLSGY
jgi:hypothetical protein